MGSFKLKMLRPKPRWESFQRSPRPLAGGEGADCPVPKIPPPLLALWPSIFGPSGLSILVLWASIFGPSGLSTSSFGTRTPLTDIYGPGRPIVGSKRSLTKSM